MVEVALSLGTNSGDRLSRMRAMELLLAEVLHPPITASTLVETEPVAVATEQPWFLNRIVRGYYLSTPERLLDECNRIERELGRTGKGMRTQRTADIDILLFGEQTVATRVLVIPHPAILERRFCMEGLCEIMPDALIATVNATVAACCAAMPMAVRLQRMHPFISDRENLHE